MLLDAVGTLDPDELLVPVGVEPFDAMATVAQSAAAATTATIAHQGLRCRRLVPSVSCGSPFCVGSGESVEPGEGEAGTGEEKHCAYAGEDGRDFVFFDLGADLRADAAVDALEGLRVRGFEKLPPVVSATAESVAGSGGTR